MLEVTGQTHGHQVSYCMATNTTGTVRGRHNMMHLNLHLHLHMNLEVDVVHLHMDVHTV